MASAGYPEGSSTGDVIVGTETLAVEDDVDVVHAGTARTDAGLVTAGGRVLAVRATGTDVADARAKAYEGISSISFPGAQWRRDIAAEPLGVVEGARVPWLSPFAAGLRRCAMREVLHGAEWASWDERVLADDGTGGSWPRSSPSGTPLPSRRTRCRTRGATSTPGTGTTVLKLRRSGDWYAVWKFFDAAAASSPGTSTSRRPTSARPTASRSTTSSSTS